MSKLANATEVWSMYLFKNYFDSEKEEQIDFPKTLLCLSRDPALPWCSRSPRASSRSFLLWPWTCRSWHPRMGTYWQSLIHCLKIGFNIKESHFKDANKPFYQFRLGLSIVFGKYTFTSECSSLICMGFIN